MPTISTDDALRDLLTGYCLWIGAGVGVHVGAAAGKGVPDWGRVVQELERAADLAPPGPLPYADRIERCFRALRRVEFQRQLRAAIVRPLSAAIVELADDHLQRKPIVPPAIRQLAHLGAIANPIVNFNVETTTSRLVAHPSGISNLRCFAPPVPGATTLLRAPHPPTMVFRRNVYHPHGAIDDSGICVMSSSEYESLRGTLGLELAVHNAFESKLAIVGMSLEDVYLREQLRSFRSQIDTIYWFVDTVPSEFETWAWANNVTLVHQPWSVFWERVEAILPGPIKEERLYSAWLGAVTEAVNECFGRTQTCRSIAVHVRAQKDQGEPIAPSIRDEWRWLARIRGEDGNDEMSLQESIGEPTQAQPAREAILRGLDGARRVDGFCHEVARAGMVFIAQELDDKVLAILRAPETRTFWSSEELAQRAFREMHGPDWATKFRAVKIPWRTASEPWRLNGPPTFSICVDGPRGSAVGPQMPAATIISKIDALSMP